MSENRHRKKSNARVNNILLVLLIVTMLGTLVAFGMNIFKIIAKESEEEQVKTVEVEKPENEFINDFYTIGHNATELNKEYFRELNTALEAQDQKAVAEAVAKCFVTEYYTWTNKDGNYDVGGMQYIYTNDQRDFEVYSRYGFYHDMDLYISQLGTENLIEVTGVTVNGVTETSYDIDDETTATAYDVDLSWTYKANSMDTADVQNSAVFKVVDHDGRMEIAAID